MEDFKVYQASGVLTKFVKDASDVRIEAGVNMWDEEWEVGSYNASTGVKESSSTQIRSVNKCAISPNTEYYLASPSNLRVCQYDENETFIRADTLPHNDVFTTQPDCHYFTINTFGTGANRYPGGTTYDNDISINYPSNLHDYIPYSN